MRCSSARLPAPFRARLLSLARLVSLALPVSLALLVSACALLPPEAPGDGDTGYSRAGRGATIPVVVLASGDHGAVHQPTAVAITDAVAWPEVWAALNADSTEPPRLPVVDFATHTVVLLCLGDRPTAGYGVSIANARRAGGALLVTVEITMPQGMVAQVATTPYLVASIAATAGEVRFQGDAVSEGYDPDLIGL